MALSTNTVLEKVVQQCPEVLDMNIGNYFYSNLDDSFIVSINSDGVMVLNIKNQHH